MARFSLSLALPKATPSALLRLALRRRAQPPQAFLTWRPAAQGDKALTSFPLCPYLPEEYFCFAKEMRPAVDTPIRGMLMASLRRRSRAGRDLSSPSELEAFTNLAGTDSNLAWRYRVAGFACWLLVVVVILYNQREAGWDVQLGTLLALIATLVIGYLIAAHSWRLHIRRLATLTQALAEQRARWEAVVQSMTEGVVIFDEAGVVCAVNPALATLFGRSETELLHRNAFTNPAWPIAMSETVAFRAVFEHRAVSAQEIQVQTSSGERILSVSAAPLPSGKGAVAVFHDVTAMRHAERELIRTERLRVAGRMAAGMAHDFNNLLMIISGRAQVLAERPEIQNEFFLRRSIEVIQQAASDGARSIERLREFTRPADQATYQPVELLQLVEDVVELTRPRWQYEKQSLGEYVQVQVTGQPQLWVMGNASELREVLTNLIFNAVDAMPDGGTLRISVEPAGHQAVIVVEDTGIGIPADQLPFIFDPFYTTKGSWGNGLGLSICQSVINQHGGQILVRSEPGRGTAFTIRLPLTDIRASPSSTPATAPLRRQRVLYVDDDLAVAATILELLLLEGHYVVTAGSAAEALQMIEQVRPTVVLTDLAMPEQNGIDLARAVRERWPDLPVGLITGWGEDLTAEQRSFVQGVLTKPVTRQALQDFLRTLASERGAGVPVTAGC